MTRFPAEFISPGEGFLSVCRPIRTGPSYRMPFICDRVGPISTFQLYVEVNRCKPLDLFMVLFIGLVFRNDVTSMLIACKKHVKAY